MAFDSLGELLVTNSGGGNVLRFNATTGAYLGIENHSASVGFTDPTSNVSQNDAFSNNVYVAWATNEFGDQQSFAAENNNAIVLTGSSDGGNSFSPPEVMNDTKFASTTELDATPRITISQGRPAHTLSASDPGVPAGQVTVVWDDFGTNGYQRGSKVDVSDAIVTDSAQAGVSYSTGVKYTATDPHSAIPASTDGSPLTTDFPLSVNISDPRFTTISHIDVRLSMLYPDLTQVTVFLIAPDGTRIPLVDGGPTGAGLGFQPSPVNQQRPVHHRHDLRRPGPPRHHQRGLQGPLRRAVPARHAERQHRRQVEAGPGARGALRHEPRTTANGIWKLEITDFSSLPGRSP